jgi:hypothetical protein
VFSEAAEQVILRAQLASQVDSSNAPRVLQTNYLPNQTIYLTYYWNQGNTGYVQTRWWLNGIYKETLTSAYITSSQFGYADILTNSSNILIKLQGTVEVFWCQDSACTSGGLAWARPFSISLS